jgi:glycosyltransferase involved in cell wall biosynthesis
LEELELGLSLEDSHHASDWKTRYRLTLTWLKLRTYLSRLLKSFRAVTVVSEREKELVLRYFPAVEKIAVIPNSLDLANYKDIQREPEPNRLIFTGSFRYHVNYEAMCWFVGKVFPRVLEQMPEVELIITGDHANLVLPACRNVTLAGHVNDVRSLIASSTIAIAPIWSGGGTRLKILEAMAIGTPVIATSKGAEGLDICSGEHFLVADDPVEFSDCVIRLLCDGELRRELAQRAGLLVREKYDWVRTLPDFMSLAESIVT